MSRLVIAEWIHMTRNEIADKLRGNPDLGKVVEVMYEMAHPSPALRHFTVAALREALSNIPPEQDGCVVGAEMEGDYMLSLNVFECGPHAEPRRFITG